jgi:predicted lipoprotein with Yx(FWY)xxD motif
MIKSKAFYGKEVRRMQVMTVYKRVILFMFAFIVMIIISGCAEGANAPSEVHDIPTIPSTNNSSNASNASDAVVKTATATVDQKSETILTDTNGRTLYYFTQDALHNVACTTGCTDTWPPLLYKGTGTVSASTNLPGQLTTEKTVNSNQVVYNGHYLYTYSGDSAPGNTKGQGIGKKWYVATPDLKQNQPVHSGGS